MTKSKKENYCVDCGASITYRSTRCHSCASKKCWADGVFDNDEYRYKQASDTKRRWERGVYDGVHTEEWRQRNSEAVKAAHKRGAYGKEWRQKKSQAMIAAHKRGELFGKEHRRRLSEAMARRWASGDMDGIFGREEHRRTKSESAKLAWARGAYGKEWRRKQSEATKKCWARGDYDGVFQSPTSIELKVAAALDIMSICHTSQYRPDGCSYIYDEFVPSSTLMEVHGDYWHGANFPESQQRDIKKAQWAEENGFQLITIWEHEIKRLGAWAIIARAFCKS